MKAAFRTALVFCLFAGPAPASAEMVFFQSGRSLSVKAYRVVGDTLTLTLRGGGEISCGRDVISRIEPDEVEYPSEATAAASAAPRTGRQAAVPEQYRQLIARTAARHGVDRRLVEAIVTVESAFQSRVRSAKGALGLMQLLPATARRYGARDLYDPKINIDAGVRHLKSLLERFDLPLALAAYNAGEAAVARFGGIPPFKETQDYVRRVLRLLDRS
jgi:soluble lytic murein transglycosylase-like protein